MEAVPSFAVEQKFCQTVANSSARLPMFRTNKTMCRMCDVYNLLGATCTTFSMSTLGIILDPFTPKSALKSKFMIYPKSHFVKYLFNK